MGKKDKDEDKDKKITDEESDAELDELAKLLGYDNAEDARDDWDKP